MAGKDQKGSGFIQSVDRALNILEIFNSDRLEIGVSDLARSLGLNKSTAFGILSTLERRGYVEQNKDNGKYRLGLKVLELSNYVLASSNIASVARPILRELVETIQETVHLAVYDQGEIVYIDKVESKQTLQIASFIGKRNPAYCTGVGKCLLAFQKEDEIKHIMNQGLTAITNKTITDPQVFLAELAEIREKNIAFDNEEFALGLQCIAAPVRNSSGEVCAAISASFPTIRSFPKKMKMFQKAISDYAMEISKGLGYHPKP